MLTVRAIVWLVVMRLALPVVPFRWLRAWIDGKARAAVPHPDNAPLAVRRAMQRATRSVGGTCLAQAMAAERLLRAGGHETTLTIGVARGEAGALPLDAHAWVASGGVIVAGDGELARYTRLVTYESGA